jgi:hypothetical protein
MRARIAVDAATGCHVWTGWKIPTGYGRIDVRINGRSLKYPAHRVAYELAKDPIPSGLQIDHLCRNRACCNPDHMEVVTAAENARRAVAIRTGGNVSELHCARGHLRSRSPSGKLVCLPCRAMLNRLYRRGLSAKVAA